MATLEKRGRSFRIIFRYVGVRYARALGTRDERAANATLSRLEDKRCPLVPRVLDRLPHPVFGQQARRFGV